jgi:hypothetical protein
VKETERPRGEELGVPRASPQGLQSLETGAPASELDDFGVVVHLVWFGIAAKCLDPTALSEGAASGFQPLTALVDGKRDRLLRFRVPEMASSDVPGRTPALASRVLGSNLPKVATRAITGHLRASLAAMAAG